MDLETVIIEPKVAHTHTVVFLHGRGDNAKHFSISLRMSTDSQNRSLIDAFPSFRWVLPCAEIRPLASFRGAQMCQWFDVWNTKDFVEREELQVEGLKQSVPAIRKILVKEAETLGGQWNRIVLAGISQGAATSAHTMLNLDLTLAAAKEEVAPRLRSSGLGAFLGFSCRMPFAGKSLVEVRNLLGLDNVPEHDDILRNTPMLLEHCVDDPLIRIRHGHELRDTLASFGGHVEWKEYPSGGHWFNAPAGIDDAVQFLNKHVLSSSTVEKPSDT